MVDDPLRSAVELAAKAVGGPVALAKSLNITSQAISQWRKIPAERVPEIAKITGLRPHLLRPDLYAAPSAHSGHTGAGVAA